MSGICGLTLVGSERVSEESHMVPMVRALSFSKTDPGTIAVFETVGMGVSPCRGYESGIVHRQVHGEEVALAFHGSLYSGGGGDQEGASQNAPAAVLEAYLREGLKCLDRLRGEFVLAIWDARERGLYLITDRFRVEPMFYAVDKERLAFASRMKSLLAGPLLQNRSVDPVSVVDIMAYSAVCTPRTIFRKIHKLPPGCVLKFKDGAVTVSAYWELEYCISSRASELELAGVLRTVMEEAVAIRLQRDRPSCNIGAFLSGGVDSTTVTGLLTKLGSGPVESFSIGFGEERFNEMEFARSAALHFHSIQHEYFVTPDDVVGMIPILMDAFDEPFANASAVPTYYCAKLAKEHHRDVLYAGDGGDELFGGNERYSEQRVFECYSRFPRWMRDGVIEPTVGWLADTIGGRLFESGKRYIRRANIPYPQRITSYGVFNIIPLEQLLSDGVVDAVGRSYDPYGPINSLYFEARANAELDRQLHIDLKHAIADNDLFKVTRMAQAAGVTVRFPFLDHQLAQFAATVPANMKMRRTELRSFFKKAYRDFLPESTRTKTKHGFGLPIPVWLRTHVRLNEMMRDLVLSPRSVQRGYFQKKALEGLVDAHQKEALSFYGTLLWNVMILELWHRQYCDAI